LIGTKIDNLGWITLNCYKFKFCRNFALDGVTVKNARGDLMSCVL